MRSTGQPPCVRHGEPLARLTTWKVGGAADWLVEPRSRHELQDVLHWANSLRLSLHPIGAGSNLLVSDEGVEGLCLCTRHLHGAHCDTRTGLIVAEAGEPLPGLARKAARAGLRGLEWAVGIPGTLGGAVAMNAGAQGSCLADRLVDVELLDPATGRRQHWTAGQLDFGYRHSKLQDMAGAGQPWIVLAARLQAEPGHDPEEVSSVTSAYLSQRIKTQPYHVPSGGSVFRNPEPRKAGRLIESLGLKGKRIGGAEISLLHGNFIVNVADACASDIDALIRLVQSHVATACGIALVTEVKRLGRFAGAS